MSEFGSSSRGNSNVKYGDISVDEKENGTPRLMAKIITIRQAFTI
jgi:hypothetical protein